MNPFKLKQLNDFTIEDCEEYIQSYPYGEHIYDVKKHLKKLNNKSVDNNLTSKDDTSNDTPNIHESDKGEQVEGNKKKNITKEIFSWIGIIAVAFIIIILLDAILPDNWVTKYKYILFPGLMALARWIQKELNW